MSETYHTPVMFQEVASFIGKLDEPKMFIDATLGEGGHSAHILETFPHIFCEGIDADDRMISRAQERLAGFEERTRLHTMWFDEYFAQHAPKNAASAILFDLGISTYHYTAKDRGFSFDSEDPLDMRIAREQTRSAEDVLYENSERELADILYTYGEEHRAQKIARAIHKHLIVPRVHPITCKDLAYVVKGCFAKERRYRFPHPATKVFQALRIVVNNELERLKKTLSAAIAALAHLGVILVISFHSLEDRIVKHFFKSHDIQNGNPDDVDGTPRLRILTKKVMRADEKEIATNPASRSAKMRVAQRVMHE